MNEKELRTIIQQGENPQVEFKECQNSDLSPVLTIDRLADRIQIVDDTLRQQTAHAVNCMLTARNWLIGCYIVEYEQKGADRAQYGEQLLKTLAHRINRKGMSWRRLYEYRSFYVSYPQLYMEILNYLQSQSTQVVTGQANILRSLPAIFQNGENQTDAIKQPQKSSSFNGIGSRILF